MPISVIDPVSPAIERARRILFQPFDLGKWFVLGFSAWLAHLGEGWGGGFNFRTGFPSGPPAGGGGGVPGPPGGQSPSPMQEMLDWLQAHLALIILVGIAVLLIIFIFGAVLTWLSSRGHFMFLDGVVRN